MARFRGALTGTLSIVLVGMVIVACGSSGPKDEVPMNETTRGLAPCPRTPNCVSSDASDSQHAIAPFRISGDPATAWNALLEHLRSMGRVTIVEETGEYVHAEAKTRIFRFVDDVEMELRAGEGIIAVRSASRVGRSDLGVNRRRIEGMRTALRARGVID